MPATHFRGQNMWLLKPTYLNRGRGIHVFNDVATLQQLVLEYCHGFTKDRQQMFNDLNSPSNAVEASRRERARGFSDAVGTGSDSGGEDTKEEGDEGEPSPMDCTPEKVA